MALDLITFAFDDLAQSLRVLLEADYHARRLLFVDRAEAVGNIETALSSVLNAFHSLSDAIDAQLTKPRSFGMRLGRWQQFWPSEMPDTTTRRTKFARSTLITRVKRRDRIE
jgi:hypothetical protein